MKIIDTSKTSEKVIKLNDQLNARCDRAVNVKNALGSKGVNLLNELFKETENFLSGRPEKVVDAVENFCDFLSVNVDKKTRFFGCIPSASKEIIQYLIKSTSLQGA